MSLPGSGLAFFFPLSFFLFGVSGFDDGIGLGITLALALALAHDQNLRIYEFMFMHAVTATTYFPA